MCDEEENEYGWAEWCRKHGYTNNNYNYGVTHYYDYDDDYNNTNSYLNYDDEKSNFTDEEWDDFWGITKKEDK